MGYARYEFENDPIQANMPRGYAVECVCAKPGCSAKIDRGLGYLCYSCTNYFCGQHLHWTAYDDRNEALEFECFAGAGSQCCETCAEEFGKQEGK